MPRTSYDKSVFFNYPIDNIYRPLFRAAVFVVWRCNFYIRCAEEEDDSSEIRINKIFQIISECKYGIHDLSRIEFDKRTRLPRFNMPLELGIFLGAKHYGVNEQTKKNCLIFENQPHSYEKYISDIKGQDIKSHRRKPSVLIEDIRNWLAINSKLKYLRSGTALLKEYQKFTKWLHRQCVEKGYKVSKLSYIDYTNFVNEWVEKQKH